MPEPVTRSSLLPPTWAVPDVFRRRLGEQAGRQRAMHEEGHLLLVLHGPPSPDSPAREGRFFWRDAAGAWTPPGTAPSQPGVAQLLAEYEKAIERLQEAEDDAKTARDYFDLLNRLNPLVRAARNMYETLQDGREAVPNDRQLLLWRDRAYTISRSAELLHNDAKNALDFAVAERAEQEAESSRRALTAAHRLNTLAACFFPIATLAAIFGVNLTHGLEGYDTAYAPLPLLAILVGGLLLGLVLMAFINRKP
jgi:hypothetical protein